MKDIVLALLDMKERAHLETILRAIPVHEIRYVKSYTEFKKMLQTSGAPDVVITGDQWIMELNLNEWLNVLKGGRKNIYWIHMGKEDTREAVKWMRNGADYFISRELSDEDLEHELRFFFERPDSMALRLTQKDVVLLQVIREISQHLDDLESLLNLAMDASMEISRAEYGSLLILQPAVDLFEVYQQRGNSQPVEATWGFFGFDQSTLKQFVEKQVPVLFNKEIPYREHASDPYPEIRTLLLAPITDQSGAVGLLMLAKTEESTGHFSRLDIDLIHTFARDLAPVIRNAISHLHAQELNYKDDLTDAYNRRYFEQFLVDEIRRSERFGARLSIIFLDLDNLKQVNEKYGHLMGSKTLQEVAHRMILAVRGSDRVVRYGGDEFCIILPETDTEGAVLVAERLKNEIAGRPFLQSEGMEIHITASFGIATYPIHGRTKEELIYAADKAMFEVKMSTKNAIHVAQPLPERDQ